MYDLISMYNLVSYEPDEFIGRAESGHHLLD